MIQVWLQVMVLKLLQAVWPHRLQLQLQVQNAVTIELMREAFAARQDLIKAVERGTLSVEEAYAMSNGGQAAMTNFRSNFQSNQEIISQIANLISAYR